MRLIIGLQPFPFEGEGVPLLLALGGLLLAKREGFLMPVTHLLPGRYQGLPQCRLLAQMVDELGQAMIRQTHRVPLPGTGLL